MGMFDEIVVHRKLPVPKQLPEELRDVKWKEVAFQTKCLENCLTHYKIAINGKLYAQKFDDEGNVFAYNAFFDAKRKDSEMFWRNMPTPPSINFYTTFQKEEFDYWVSFTAFFESCIHNSPYFSLNSMFLRLHLFLGISSNKFSLGLEISSPFRE